MPGDKLSQPDLGATLARIEAYGTDGFYKGKTAKLIVDRMQRSGGLISYKDLENYKVFERQPICGTYRAISLCAMPPPSSGGVHLVQMLNTLENWTISDYPHNSLCPFASVGGVDVRPMQIVVYTWEILTL